MNSTENPTVGARLQKLAEVLEHLSWNPSFVREEITELLNVLETLSLSTELNDLLEGMHSLRWKSHWDVIEACRLLRVVGTRIKASSQMLTNIEIVLETIEVIEHKATTVLCSDIEHTRRLQNSLPLRKHKHQKHGTTGIHDRATPSPFSPNMVHWDGSVDDAEKLIEVHVSKYGWMF